MEENNVWIVLCLAGQKVAVRWEGRMAYWSLEMEPIKFSSVGYVGKLMCKVLEESLVILWFKLVWKLFKRWKEILLEKFGFKFL